MTQNIAHESYEPLLQCLTTMITMKCCMQNNCMKILKKLFCAQWKKNSIWVGNDIEVQIMTAFSFWGEHISIKYLNENVCTLFYVAPIVCKQ